MLRRCGIVAVLLTGFLGITLNAPALSGEKAVDTTWVSYWSGTDTVHAFLAAPTGKGPHPALLVIHEWWGLNDWIKGNAMEFARRGYLALAVDLYRGSVASTPEEAHVLMRGVPEDRAVRDLKAAVSYVKSRHDADSRRVASIGWCMGGGYSLDAALNTRLAADVVCYGRLVTEKAEIDRISCPILGIFGGQDRGIPPGSVKEFEKAAKAEGKNVQTFIYDDAGHAFMNQNNTQGYRQKDTEDAWSKIYAFLDTHLKRPGKTR